MTSPTELQHLEQQAMLAMRNGQLSEANQLWETLLQAAPNSPRTLAALAQSRFLQGDFNGAKTALERLIALEPANPQHWISLALTSQRMSDEVGEENAIREALIIDAYNLHALILKAALLEKQGKSHQAATAHGAVASVAPPLDKLPPEIRHAVMHAMQYRDRYQTKLANYLDENLHAEISAMDSAGKDRFGFALDILSGRKQRYESQSMVFHYPGLLPVEFFDRKHFPWMESVEAQTSTIRDEFMQVLSAEEGFTPYLTYASDLPLNQFAELNNSPRWSAFHLKKSGEVIRENADKCPATMAALSGVPQPDQPGRTPAAMFSLLKPHTRIPPHTGVTNSRLVTHLPLIVPEKCGFRVGNTTREWVPGIAWVFDDTIEHEAWNLSDKLRVVLIFDVWHPALSESERMMITSLMRHLNTFTGETPSADL